MADQNVELVKGAYDAFAKGDLDALFGAMSDDIEWNEALGMPYGGVYHGRDEITQRVLGPITQDITDFKVTADEVHGAGDTVVVIARYRGTGKATGRELDEGAVHVWDVRDGRIVRFRQYMDTVRFGEVVPAAESVTA